MHIYIENYSVPQFPPLPTRADCASPLPASSPAPKKSIFLSAVGESLEQCLGVGDLPNPPLPRGKVLAALSLQHCRLPPPCRFIWVCWEPFAPQELPPVLSWPEMLLWGSGGPGVADERRCICFLRSAALCSCSSAAP